MEPITTRVRRYLYSVQAQDLEKSPASLPALISRAGEHARKRYLEFFTAEIRNKGTRQAYGYAANRFFAWCQEHGIALEDIEPIVVATYIEQLTTIYSAPTVKLHLAAVRMLFDYLVTGHVIATNPAAAVRGPKYSIKKGKTPVLTATEARELLDSIDISTIAGLRYRALIGVMVKLCPCQCHPRHECRGYLYARQAYVVSPS